MADKSVKDSDRTEWENSVKGLSGPFTRNYTIINGTTINRADWVTLGAVAGQFEGPARAYDVNADGTFTTTDAGGNVCARNVKLGMRVIVSDLETIATTDGCEVIAGW